MVHTHTNTFGLACLVAFHFDFSFFRLFFFPIIFWLWKLKTRSIQTVTNSHSHVIHNLMRPNAMHALLNNHKQIQNPEKTMDNRWNLIRRQISTNLNERMCCVCCCYCRQKGIKWNGKHKRFICLGNKFTCLFSSALLFMIQMAWLFEHSWKGEIFAYLVNWTIATYWSFELEMAPDQVNQTSNIHYFEYIW